MGWMGLEVFLIELPELSQNQARVLPLYNRACSEAGFTFLCGFGGSGYVPMNGLWKRMSEQCFSAWKGMMMMGPAASPAKSLKGILELYFYDHKLTACCKDNLKIKALLMAFLSIWEMLLRNFMWQEVRTMSWGSLFCIIYLNLWLYHKLRNLGKDIWSPCRSVPTGQRRWFMAEDLLTAAERLFADTSRAGGEALGNKELRGLRTCPGKTPPPPFALIILFFSILHPHNNVSGPVLMHWITQRLQLRSGIQRFPEPDPASFPSSGKGNVPLFPRHACKRGLCCLGLGMRSLQKPETRILGFVFFVALCTCETSAWCVFVPVPSDSWSSCFRGPAGICRLSEIAGGSLLRLAGC